MHKGQYQGLLSGDANGLNKGLVRGQSRGLMRNERKIKPYKEFLQRNGEIDEPFDIDYLFLLAVAQSKGYSLPSTNCQRSGNRLVRLLKQYKIWAVIDVLYVYATDGDQDFATLNWKYPQARQNTRVNTLTFTSNAGYAGNGSNSYLNTNFNLGAQSNWGSQNNNAWAIGINSNPAGASVQVFGSRRTTGNLVSTGFFPRLATDLTSARVNSAVADAIAASNANAIGDYVGYRTGATAMSLDKDGAFLGTDSSANSVAFPNQNVYVGAANQEGTAVDFSTHQITHIMFGGFAAYKDIWNTLWKQYFQSLGVAQTQPKQTVYNNLSWNRYVQPIVNSSKDSLAKDYSQCSFSTFVEHGNTWFIYYLGSSALIDSDRDRVFLATKRKGNDVYQGWEKALDGSSRPFVVIDVGAGGAFDESQVFPGATLIHKNQFYMWYIGHNTSGLYRIGLATSLGGVIYTKYATTPVYTDAALGAVGITNFKVIYNSDIKKFVAVYQGIEQGDNTCVAESVDGINWTKTKGGLVPAIGLGRICCVKYIAGTYYLWADFSWRFFSGISEYIKLITTTDFVTFTDLGIQTEYLGGNEYGLAYACDFFRKPTGEWAMLNNSYRTQIAKTANEGEEFTCIRVAELGSTGPIPIASKRMRTTYPSYVTRHYSTAPKHFNGTNFFEQVNGDTGTINTAPAFGISPTFGARSLDYLVGQGSQTVTFTGNNGALFNPANFGVKVKISSVEITGTRQIFKIGADIIMTLEAGNLQVILSADGVAETKKYISTADISKPSGLNYVDDHIYVGFTWIGGVLTLYNDFVPFAVTKTNDGALTNVNMSTSDILLFNNTAIAVRSASILSNATDQQFIDLEIG